MTRTATSGTLVKISVNPLLWRLAFFPFHFWLEMTLGQVSLILDANLQLSPSD